MGSFDDLLEFNAALVEDEMDYAYFKEHYLDDNSSLLDDDSDNDFDTNSFDDEFGLDDGEF